MVSARIIAIHHSPLTVPGSRFTVYSSRFLPAHLPGSNYIDRQQQHKYFQQQAVSDPYDQNQLQHDKADQRAFQAQALGDHESHNAAEDVAKRVGYGVACITERRCCRAVSFDDEVCIFKDFP